MDTTKKHFIDRVNSVGVLFLRERSSEEDLTGWGALEFILNNGEIFVISGEPFGQGSGEDGLWVDMNKLEDETFKVLKANCKKSEIEDIDSVASWLRHQKAGT